MNQRNKALCQLAFTALLWSLAGVCIKAVNLSGPAIAGIRSAIAFVFLFAIMPKTRPVWSKNCLAGAACYALTMLTFVTATKLTTAANAILLQYTAPFYVAVAAPRLLGETTRKADWLTLAAAFGGMTLFFMGDLSGDGLLGNILAIVSGLSFAGLAVFLRGQKDASPWHSVLLGNALTAAVCLPFCLQTAPGPSDWLVLAFLGVVQTGLSYYLYSLAIKHVRALDALLVPIVEPVLNPAWVLLVHGEQPSPQAVLGGAIVLAASAARGVLVARALPPSRWDSAGGDDRPPVGIQGAKPLGRRRR
ncbi:MAG: DMT family transporter [Desulfovibrionaceae bacterium]|nr:DMT family transporter [Desulfovibrionaceae bacterium]MBF0512974.1 DMT family transporter [Desulfovibrionaceae bacterium]